MLLGSVNTCLLGDFIQVLVLEFFLFMNVIFNTGKSGAKTISKPNQGGKKEEKLHPSWEAKRRKIELESKPVAFQGKKITFDDD